MFFWVHNNKVIEGMLCREEIGYEIIESEMPVFQYEHGKLIKKESEKLKERKEYTIDFTDKTDCNIYFKGEPIIGNNKYSPYLPECNELIDIIIHNTQFYNDSNHLENLENIYNFKKNTNDYENKNKLIIEYKGKGEKEGISLFGDKFISNNKDKIKIFINQKEYNLIENEKYKINEENIIVMLVEKDQGIIEDMSYLFSSCKNIISLITADKWDTYKVKNMNYLFNGCSLLESINLSSFNTINANYMNCMFFKCSSLSSLNLSSFNTNKVNNMRNIFEGCTSLKKSNVITNDANLLEELKILDD